MTEGFFGDAFKKYRKGGFYIFILWCLFKFLIYSQLKYLCKKFNPNHRFNTFRSELKVTWTLRYK